MKFLSAVIFLILSAVLTFADSADSNISSEYGESTSTIEITSQSSAEDVYALPRTLSISSDKLRDRRKMLFLQNAPSADSTDFTIDTPCEKEFFVFTKTLEESLFSVAISRNIFCDTSIKNYWDCFVAIPQKADGISVIKLLL